MIYKITFKNSADKYVVADEVDAYGKIATFSRRVQDPLLVNNQPFGHDGIRRELVASYTGWRSIEEVDSIPFNTSQSFNSPEDI